MNKTKQVTAFFVSFPKLLYSVCIFWYKWAFQVLLSILIKLFYPEVSSGKSSFVHVKCFDVKMTDWVNTQISPSCRLTASGDFRSVSCCPFLLPTKMNDQLRDCMRLVLQSSSVSLDLLWYYRALINLSTAENPIYPFNWAAGNPENIQDVIWTFFKTFCSFKEVI